MMDNISLINFIDLTLEEKKMILQWRNHNNIKCWMYTQDIILLENHLNFIELLKQADDKLYFVIRKDKQYVGVIDFTQIIDDRAYIGLYANPSLKGIGKLLMDIIINYAFNVLNLKILCAEVLEKNKKALELYKKNKFVEIDEKDINNSKVICLELENENR